MTREQKIKEAKKVLEENGYYTETLWHIDDVHMNYKCDRATAMELLKYTLTNELVNDTIWDTMCIIADQDMDLESVD